MEPPLGCFDAAVILSGRRVGSTVSVPSLLAGLCVVAGSVVCSRLSRCPTHTSRCRWRWACGKPRLSRFSIAAVGGCAVHGRGMSTATVWSRWLLLRFAICAPALCAWRRGGVRNSRVLACRERGLCTAATSRRGHQVSLGSLLTGAPLCLPGEVVLRPHMRSVKVVATRCQSMRHAVAWCRLIFSSA